MLRQQISVHEYYFYSHNSILLIKGVLCFFAYRIPFMCSAKTNSTLRSLDFKPTGSKLYDESKLHMHRSYWIDSHIAPSAKMHMQYAMLWESKGTFSKPFRFRLHLVIAFLWFSVILIEMAIQGIWSMWIFITNIKKVLSNHRVIKSLDGVYCILLAEFSWASYLTF